MYREIELQCAVFGERTSEARKKKKIEMFSIFAGDFFSPLFAALNLSSASFRLCIDTTFVRYSLVFFLFFFVRIGCRMRRKDSDFFVPLDCVVLLALSHALFPNIYIFSHLSGGASVFR